MLSRGRLAFVAVSLIAVLLVVTGTILAASGTDVDDGSDSLYKYLSVFTEVLGLVKRAYVEDTDLESLIAGAFEGTMDGLDPFSFYVPAAHVEEFVAAQQVGGRRSGLVVLKERGAAYVVTVEKGSPAEESGLERGDVLSAVDGRSTRKMPLWKIQSLFAGAAGTRLEIERLRFMDKATVVLELRDFERPGVVLEARRGLPVLRLHAFETGTASDVELTLRSLADGAPELPDLAAFDKLVVDIRGAAGGDLEEGYRVAGLFTGGELGELRSRGESVQSFSGGESSLWQGQTVVLLDRGTQGAAEVLASVLEQKVGAVLVGQRTFGYAGRLRVLELSNGGRLQVTDAFYTGPDRQPILSALEPAVPVSRPTFGADQPDPELEDLILERGLAVLLGELEVPSAEEDAA